MTDKLNTVEWSDDILTGISSIDEQHQMLAAMIKSAQNQLTEHSSRIEIEAIVRELMTYALFHFDTEEELMATYDYDPAEREKHCQEHRQFSAAIAQFQRNIHLGQLVSREELLGFVQQWLASHIVHTDKKLGEFLSNLKLSDL